VLLTPVMRARDEEPTAEGAAMIQSDA